MSFSKKSLCIGDLSPAHKILIERPVVTSIIACTHYKIHSFDVKSTFLQGNLINRYFYVQLPKGAETKNLWKLQTTIYRLCDMSGVCYLSLK